MSLIPETSSACILIPLRFFSVCPEHSPSCSYFDYLLRPSEHCNLLRNARNNGLIEIMVMSYQMIALNPPSLFEQLGTGLALAHIWTRILSAPEGKQLFNVTEN